MTDPLNGLDEQAIEATSAEAEETLLSGYEPEDDETPLRVSPIDRRLITQPIDLSIRTIVGQIDDLSLIVQPDYQRRYVWDDALASRLIESLLMNIPIPGCFFSEEQNGTFTVIDGQQRLYSAWRFVRGGFKLRHLRTLPEYNGKRFADLSEREQRLILGRSIRCTIINQESHPEIKFEVFERLNTGSMPLTDQEIRNAIYRGEFNRLLQRLADQPRWLAVLNKRRLDKRMRDDELILRFFALNDEYMNYQPPLRSFLNEYACRCARDFTESDLQRLEVLFEATVDKVRNVFEEHAFRVYTEDHWEKPVNRALFDTVMLNFSKLNSNDLASKKSEINNALMELCKNERFRQAVGRSTADRNSLVTRIVLFSHALADLGLNTELHSQLSIPQR